METQRPTTLAAFLRAERERAGLSQRQLASRVGVNHAYLARLESGEMANPSGELLQRIADVLEISSAELLGFIGVRSAELPELAPYLRTKYRLDEAAIAEIAERVQRLAQNKDEANE